MMWTTVVLTSVWLFMAVPALSADKIDAAKAHDANKELAALERKMHGAWKGGGCDGRFLFREDGTYELTEYGPAADDSKGTWKVRWDALPPTLVLTCKTSESRDEIGKTMEVKLIKLDDKHLAVEYATRNGNPPGQYTRVKK
jgi:hypothetical protein